MKFCGSVGQLPISCFLDLLTSEQQDEHPPSELTFSQKHVNMFIDMFDDSIHFEYHVFLIFVIHLQKVFKL